MSMKGELMLIPGEEEILEGWKEYFEELWNGECKLKDKRMKQTEAIGHYKQKELKWYQVKKKSTKYVIDIRFKR